MATKKYVDLDGLSHFKLKNDALYQAQEAGKGLSSNDYTTTEKNKLAGIAAGAQVNVIETIKVNNVAQTVSSKAVNITVPTNNNQLTNGAGYITGINSNDVTTALGYTPYNATNPNGYQTSSEVNSAINTALAGITGIDFQIVQTLPSTGTKGVIYLVSNGGSGTNVYDEYIWVNNTYEKIGTTAVDLTNYVQYSDLVPYTNAEIDALFA